MGGGASDEVSPENAEGARWESGGVESGVVGDVGEADGEELWAGRC